MSETNAALRALAIALSALAAIALFWAIILLVALSGGGVILSEKASLVSKIVTGSEGLDAKIILSILIPSLVAIAGWFFAHRLTIKRERANKRRELRLKGLEQAYLALAMVSNRELTPEFKFNLERFIAEIQLYGTPQQIALTTDIVKALIEKRPEIQFDPLLTVLRDSLRAELDMEPLIGTIWWYRFELPLWKRKRLLAQAQATSQKTKPILKTGSGPGTTQTPGQTTAGKP